MFANLLQSTTIVIVVLNAVALAAPISHERTGESLLLKRGSYAGKLSNDDGDRQSRPSRRPAWARPGGSMAVDRTSNSYDAIARNRKTVSFDDNAGSRLSEVVSNPELRKNGPDSGANPDIRPAAYSIPGAAGLGLSQLKSDTDLTGNSLTPGQRRHQYKQEWTEIFDEVEHIKDMKYPEDPTLVLSLEIQLNNFLALSRSLFPYPDYPSADATWKEKCTWVTNHLVQYNDRQLNQLNSAVEEIRKQIEFVERLVACNQGGVCYRRTGEPAREPSDEDEDDGIPDVEGTFER